MTFARRVTAVSLLITPLLLLLASVIGPDLSDDAAERLVEIEDNKGTYVTSSILFLLSPYALVPAMGGLAYTLRGGRRPTLGQLGAMLILVGGISTLAFYGIALVEYEAATGEFDAAEMADLLDAVEESDLGIPFLILFLGGLVVGSILLAIGIWRTGIAPAWAGAAIVLSTLVNFLGESKAVSIISFVLLLIGFGGVALSVNSMSHDEWTRPKGP